MEKQEEVLSYDRVVLRRSDLDLLRGPHYLNDCLIEFYFSYLSNVSRLHNIDHGDYSKDDILLVPPALSFWLANSVDSSDSLKEFEETHEVPKKQIVIFTVNNNANVEIGGGTHWSLLVYYRKSNTFVHYDSLRGLNNSDARKLYRAVKKHVGSCTTTTTTTTTTTSSGESGVSSSSSSSSCTTSSNIGLIRDTDHDEKNINVRMAAKKTMKRARLMPNIHSQIMFPRFLMTIKGDYDDDDDDDDDDEDEDGNGIAAAVPHCLRHYKYRQYFINNSPTNYYVDSTVVELDSSDDDKYPGFRKLPTPQQTNLYDCGLYVMAIARVICEWYCAASSNSSSSSSASASATTTITRGTDDGADHELQISNIIDDDDDDLDCRFPNIMKHVDTSLESTMRCELLALIRQLKAQYSPSFDDQPAQPQPQPQQTNVVFSVLRGEKV